MIIALIQARMGSTRLRGKVLMPLGGKPAIDHVISRAKNASQIDDVIVVTSIDPANLPLIHHVSGTGTRVFVGSEDDVLDRFWQATRLTRAAHIVRITADCPLLDPRVVDEVIKTHLEKENDYTSNTDPPTWPDGLDVEVMKRSVLEAAWRESSDQHDREHVTPFMRRNNTRFRLENVGSPRDLSHHRWTLDQDEDYQLLSRVFDEMTSTGALWTTSQVLEFLDSHPELLHLNARIIRNEGSLKTQGNDRDE